MIKEQKERNLVPDDIGITITTLDQKYFRHDQKTALI